MKSKRRQELKTNDLAAWLDDVRHSASKWGGYLLIVLVLIVAVVVIYSNMQKARLESGASDYEDLQKANSMQVLKMDKTEEELRASLTTIDKLVAGTGDVSFKITALFDKATMATYLAQRAMGGTTGAAGAKANPELAKQYLAEARAAYEQVIRDYSDRTLFYGRALNGRFQVDALAFVLDGDIAHRAPAVQSLEKLRDDPRFNATPLQTIAIGHLKNIDQMFTVVQFPNRPSPSPAPAPVTVGPIQPGENMAISSSVPTPAPESTNPQEATPEPVGDAPAPAAPAGTPTEPADAEPTAPSPSPTAAEPQDAAPEGE